MFFIFQINVYSFFKACITCINFNRDSTCIVVSSDHGTIHVFNLDESKTKESGSGGGGGGGGVGLSIIPKYFSSQWSFCKFSVPQGPPCICAFGADNNSVIGELFLFEFWPQLMFLFYLDSHLCGRPVL